MKIKVLVVPTLLIVACFVALNFIKPDFDTYMEKRSILEVARKNAEQAATLANNLSVLGGELETQSDKVVLTNKYLPADKDQGRMFDGLNFLVGQSGLLTSKIEVNIVEEEEESMETFGTLDPVADADPLAIVDTTGTGGAMPTLAPYQAPKVRNYALSLEALGGYPNMKEFLKRAVTMERLQDIESFKIAVGEVPGTEGTLTLTYKTNLPYQETPALVTGETMISIPGLQQSNFDFAAIDTLKATATTVPDMVLGNEGKANPFE